jgi:hypothetical protein
MHSPLFTPLQIMHAFKEHNGYWEPYPGHELEDWRTEIANDDTRQGYWQWVEDRIEQEMHNE